MKLLLVLLIFLEVFLVVLLFSPVTHDSFERARLVAELHENPNSEKEARLKAIHAKEMRHKFIMNSILLAFIAADGVGIFLVSRKIRR